MSLDNDDFENIDFDSDWQCSSQETTNNINDIINNSSSTVLRENHQWLSVRLPHIVKTDQQNDSNIINPYNWWYRKQFDWFLSDQQSEHQIYLIIEPSNNEDNLNTSNIIGSIWINGVQIFSNSLLSKEKLIELPSNLLHSDETSIKNKHRNTLVVCCENVSLSLHVRLVVSGPMNCASGRMKIDEKTVEDNNDEKDDNSLNYTVRLNETDGRFRLAFKNWKQKLKIPVSSSPSSTTNYQIKSSIDKKQSEDKKESLEDILVPHLSIVILIVGTRGDVQPFVALGQSLLAAGHRVRLATHESFRSFVRGNGLEFFPLAGDPADLMSFMVKNAGIIPSVSSIVQGDVAKNRRILSDILASTWLACTADDDETFVPFTAEAIIANPPSFGHVHCAEKLQIPLHIMFTMPWSPTTAFPHPLCNIDSSKGPTEKINLYSYYVVEILTWSGMHTIVNCFRKKILGLSPLNRHEATNVIIDQRIPHTYCWSRALASKPSDWGSHINVSGFFFLDLGTGYTNPPQNLIDFLGISNDHHDSQHFLPPIYIGFGSITGHDSRRLLQVVVDALSKTGYRALLSGLATDDDHLPEQIFKIGNVPHDWLFQHVSVVCHHGGAGTTAAGLRAGKPTIIVPFFGDQFFWGSIMEKSGAGPRPLPGKSITAVELADAFRFAHQPATRVAAENIRLSMAKENGCESAVRAFHAHLPVDRMRSDIESRFAACYRIDGLNIQISRPVSDVLIAAGRIDITQLRSHRIREWQLHHDHRIFALTHTVSERIKKSSSILCINNHTNLSLADSSSTSSLSINENNNTLNIDKNFHQDKSYQKIKEFNRVVPLSDPYSESNTHGQSSIIDSKSSIKTTKRLLCLNQKIGLSTFLKRSHRDHQRHGTTTITDEVLIPTTNSPIKPVTGTFPSTNWLDQPSMDMAKETVTNTNIPEQHSQLKTTSGEHHEKGHNENCAGTQIASVISGLSSEICLKILLQFDQISTERKQTTMSSSSPKKHTKHKFQFQRQRSHSTSAID